MPHRLLLPLACVLGLVVLAGCGGSSSEASLTQNVDGVRDAVRQQYQSEQVQVNVRQHDNLRQLEVTLANPGGREATTQESARRVARAAHERYGSAEGASSSGALDTVLVSFEFASAGSGAQMGFYRRYSFAPGDLQGNTSSAPDTSGIARPDTAASS